MTTCGTCFNVPRRLVLAIALAVSVIAFAGFPAIAWAQTSDTAHLSGLAGQIEPGGELEGRQESSSTVGDSAPTQGTLPGGNGEGSIAGSSPIESDDHNDSEGDASVAPGERPGADKANSDAGADAADADYGADDSANGKETNETGKSDEDPENSESNFERDEPAENQDDKSSSDATGNDAPLTPAASTLPAPTATQLQDTGVVMHRLYNPNSGEHLYTSSTSERDSLTPLGWRYEGVGWIAPSSGSPVHRLYNPNSGDHHYTLSEQEYKWLLTLGWRYEGVCWYSGGSYKIYRQFNPNEQVGTHNYTPYISEHNWLVGLGWRGEGVGWYALADTPATLSALILTNSASVRAVVASGDASTQASSSVTVNAVLVGDTYYLCLPSFANLSALQVSGLFKGAETGIYLATSGSKSFQGFDAGSVVDVASISKSTASNGARLYWFTTPKTSIIQKLAIMLSGQISAVNITSVNVSQGRGYVEADPNHTVKADVLITVIDKDGQVLYNADAVSNASTIKGRGNNTWSIGNKKPYQISLNAKFDFITGTATGNNAQKKWLLLANANDVTMLHTTIAYNLGLELGMAEGTECVPVDLYYDGEYRGSYLVCEKIQIKKGRINITDLEELFEKANKGVDFASLAVKTATNAYGHSYRYVEGVADPDDLTGGYILELDFAYYEKEICYFSSSWGTVVVKSPEYCSQNAMKYISEYFEAALRNLNSGATTDNKVFDIDSLAKTYLISEFAKNIDAFCTSTYFFKDSDAKANGNVIFASPLWDFDACMGVRKDWHDWSFASYHGFVLPHATTVMPWRPVAVASVPAVQDRVRELWTLEMSNLVKNVLLSSDQNVSGQRGYLRSLTYYRNQIAASQQMNQVLYGLTAFNNELTPFDTYDQNIQYLTNWLTWRTAWIDGNIDRLSGGRIDNAPWTYGGVDYSLVFDASYYKQIIGNPSMSDAAALEHFVIIGMAQGHVASRNFNVTVYRNRYADLRTAFGNDLKQYYLHFIQYGFKENRLAI